MCKKECGEKGTTIKPDGGGIKHAENSQTIDKRIQFSEKSGFITARHRSCSRPRRLALWVTLGGATDVAVGGGWVCGSKTIIDKKEKLEAAGIKAGKNNG